MAGAQLAPFAPSPHASVAAEGPACPACHERRLPPLRRGAQDKPLRLLRYRPDALHAYGWIPGFPHARNLRGTVLADHYLILQARERVYRAGWRETNLPRAAACARARGHAELRLPRTRRWLRAGCGCSSSFSSFPG